MVYDQKLATRWDLRFLALAEHIAGWSKDPTTQVGAVIAQGKLFVSLGFNGFPAGVGDQPERYVDRDTKLLLTVHAEANAILHARRQLYGCTLYVSRPPCSRCAGLIVQAGIHRLTYRVPPADFADRWRQDMEAAALMFREADVIAIGVP